MNFNHYATYLINADGRETELKQTLWRQEAIDFADGAIVGRLPGTRIVVVKWNSAMDRDELVHEVTA